MHDEKSQQARNRMVTVSPLANIAKCCAVLFDNCESFLPIHPSLTCLVQLNNQLINPTKRCK